MPMAATQQAPRKGCIGHRADAEMGAGGQIVSLRLAIQRMIIRLGDDRARHVKAIGDADQLGDHPWSNSCKAPMADFARFDQPSYRLDDLLQIAHLTVATEVVNIDTAE